MIKKRYTWLHDTLLQSATLPKRDEMTHRTSISASSLILQDRDSVISSLPEGALENMPKRLGTRRFCSKSFSDPWGFLELIETGIDFVDLEFWWGIVVVFWICKTCSYRFMWLITRKTTRWLGYKSIDKLFKQFPLLLNYDMENIKIPWEKQTKKAGRQFQMIENRFDVLKSCFLRTSASSSNFQVMVEGWGVRFVRICVMSRFFSLETTKSQIEGAFYLFSSGNVGWWKIQ